MNQLYICGIVDLTILYIGWYIYRMMEDNTYGAIVIKVIISRTKIN